MEGRCIARYEVLEKLGEGGMGAVYKGRDAWLNRFVALKLLAAGGRFLGEARAIAALNHPHIETIYEISECDGAPVLVLEYLPGGTLAQRIRKRPLSMEDLVRYGLQIADGLEYAHRRGLVHGDVKPDNLMFAEDGWLKITDFGLARFDDGRTVTLEGKIAGTLRYMAPECLDGRAADRQSDVFSFGAVLNEMAGGQALPEAFEELVRRATARDRGRRFARSEEVAAGLRRLRPAPATVPDDTPTILVVEDDDALRTAVEAGLAGEGYQVLEAGNGRDGMRLAAEANPHLVLLDVMMPGLNGFDVCRQLRHRGFAAPIIMVTGRAEEVDRVVGLEIGADDYLVKPYSQRELLARVRAHLRRAQPLNGRAWSVGPPQGSRHPALTNSLPDPDFVMDMAGRRASL